ncbi:MAG TPA: FlgD immunoglobulin-like domain containing protein [Candidatus Eisenbacteria bacterium]
MPPHRVGWLILALFLVTADVATAINRSPVEAGGAIALPPGSLVRTGDPTRQRDLGLRPAWQAFRAAYGPWEALWNEATGTPHRAFGPGIPLEGFANDPAAVDHAVRRFVVRHPQLFGGRPALETVRAAQVGGIWYLTYRQTVRGVPVLFEDWEFRVGANGNLMLFGADAHPMDARVETRPLLVGAVAREAARAGLDFDPATDRIEGGEQLYLLPYSAEDGIHPRLVYDVRVQTANPPGNWIALVDAANGEVLWRHNLVRPSIDGNVSGDVHLVLPTDLYSRRPFAHETVTVENNTVTTDAAGHYSAPASGQAKVSAKLQGPFVTVTNQNGTNASFSVTSHDGSTVDILWGSSGSPLSLDSERDGFYHVNVVHDYITTLDPGFTGDNYSMPCKVEVAGTCNAFWDGNGLNFYAAGGGCPSAATMPDVVYHEYGHSINDKLYLQVSGSFGMLNGALHEGMADVNAAFLQDDPIIGQGFYGPGTSLRTLDNTFRWPQDRSGDPHVTGLIIAGAFWDLRQAVGLSLADSLAHFAKYGTPDDFDDGVAMSEYFLETLVWDDRNDGNLANGTPHSAAITAAFNQHGIGTSYFIDIYHVALADQPDAGPYPVTATIRYTSTAFGGLDPASPTLHYAVNGAPYVSAPMSPTGNPDQYTASIPSTSRAIVHYHLSAGDVNGGVQTEPPGAPSRDHVFLVGPAVQSLAYDMEADPGWTVGDPLDNATTGVWIRAEPVGTSTGGVQVQPELDHTPDPGSLCFVTGNAAPGDPLGTNDVDGGRTTLTTPVFDAVSGGMQNPIIEYYRWYTNNSGASPTSDFWRVEISNDAGANWVPVEGTLETDNTWRRVLFFIGDYLTPTTQMRLRFIAEDLDPTSLVEAAVDDFRLLGFPATTAVGDRPIPARTELMAATPNPFRDLTRLRYRLATPATVTLRIFDVGGRLVRTVESGTKEAGAHTVVWDGRDESGRSVPSGSFFARLSVEGREIARRLIRAR